jgi:hypothetical protein
MLQSKFRKVHRSVFKTVCIHMNCRSLVDADVHRLAREPAPDEEPHEILRNLSETLQTSDQRILTSEAPRDRAVAIVVEFRVFEQRRELLTEVAVDDLQLGNAVLVVQRDSLKTSSPKRWACTVPASLHWRTPKT